MDDDEAEMYLPPELAQSLHDICFTLASQLSTDAMRLRLLVLARPEPGHPLALDNAWTTLNISGTVAGLDALFARSAPLPFDVSVTVASVTERVHLDDCLRKHAHRLRALCISDKDFEKMGRMQGLRLFRYRAPSLEHFSLQFNNRNIVLTDIFNGHAPNLRSVILDGLPVLAACPAFSHLTSLALKSGSNLCRGDVQHMFKVAPVLERLEITNLRDMGDLLPIPTVSRLHKVTVTAERASLPKLRTLGYLGIPELEASIANSDILDEVAMHQDPMELVMLSIGYPRPSTTEVTIQSRDGAKASFIVPKAPPFASGRLIRTASTFLSLERLVLPSTTSYAASDLRAIGEKEQVNGHMYSGMAHRAHRGLALAAAMPLYPYLADTVRLTALRTLAFAHGSPGAFSLFNPQLVHADIIAPLLSRVEIVRCMADRDAGSGAASAIRPGFLAQFIQAHIQCGDVSALELYIAPENADLLDQGDTAGIERLRECVGKLIVWYAHPSRGFLIDNPLDVAP
ncbi:hypothetical protein AURDEDRAFT_161752 [Auricularia subglabra TFB-10046 SS5]|nr:hypothetical protein AURDEDRAFT_161752 [Auricularia subglabra TFB-10046 SS5]